MDKLKEIQSEQNRRYIRGKIEAYITRIFELDSDKPVAQHFWTILRSKGDGSTPFNWNDDKFLGVIESYYKEFRKIKEEEYDGQYED